MRGYLFRRFALTAVVIAAACAASTYAVGATPTPARAQAADPALSATLTPTPSPMPTSTGLPTPADPAAPTTTDTSVATDTATSQPSVTPTPTATPVPPPADLPALAAQPDQPGTVASGVVGSEGGRISSGDGRIVVDFPAGAVDADTAITVTARDASRGSPPPAAHTTVGAWELDASTAGKAVHQFDRELTFTLRFTPDELAGLDPGTLAFWTFDEATQTWQPVPSTLDPKTGALVAHAGHFTGFDATADNIVNTAPLLDGHNIDLHSGASSLSIPLQLPPGRAGLTPSLTLTYSSARVSSLTQFTSTGSWVGQGWDIGTSAITISPSGSGNKYFLSMDGISGEMIQTIDGWRMKDEQFLKITGGCQQGILWPLCAWSVTDKSGTVFSFGFGTENLRWYYVHSQGEWEDYPVVYQADLASIQDVHGNRVDFTYWHDEEEDCSYGTPCSPTYVRAGYLQDIYYNYDHEATPQPQTHVHINLKFDDGANLRPDTPRDTSTPCTYKAPRVVETRAIDSVDVSVAGQPERRYDFDYDSTPFTVVQQPQCQAHAGNLTLRSLAMRRQSGGDDLYTMSFTYESKHSGYGASGNEFDWPYLTRVDNGIGGVVLFGYTEMLDALNHQWTREILTQETHQSWGGLTVAGQPDVVSTIEYPQGVAYRGGSFDAEYVGASEAVEVMADSQVEHNYYPANLADKDDPLPGREYETTTYDATGTVQWSKTETTWTVRGVAMPTLFGYKINSTVPTRVDTYMLDGTHTAVESTYDGGIDCAVGTCYGLLTRKDDLGDVDDVAHNAEVITNTAYVINPSKWIMVPKYVEKLSHSGALLSCTRSYYDGYKTLGGVGARGLLTAQSSATATTTTEAQCEGAAALASSINTYTVYNDDGLPIQVSNPTDRAPENQTQPGSYQHGWIPDVQPPIPFTTTDYDQTLRLNPWHQTNQAGQTTTTTYDAAFLKPDSITEPNGHVTAMTYDDFGRLSEVYDNYDPANPGTPLASPTTHLWEFTYDWGAAPNTTASRRYTDAGSRLSVTCLDGFGREVERHDNYAGASANTVRTDYDAAGRKAVVTQPATNGTSASCNSSPQSTFYFDRTSYAHDPLGNVTVTMVIPAQHLFDTTSIVQDSQDGLTAVHLDENMHRTVQTRDLVARTTTVEEDTGKGTAGDPWTAYATTTYQYDALQQLVGVTDAAGDETAIGYDLAGRKVSMADPDMGTWSYGYDPAGRLTSQTDARLVSTALVYDDLGRLTSKSYSKAGSPAPSYPTIAFLYDSYPADPESLTCASPATAVGMMTRMTDGAGKQFSCYDLRSRATTTRRTFSPSDYYDYTDEYDALGQVSAVTYPDGERIAYAESAQGDITGMASDSYGTLLSGAQRTPWGALNSFLLGNGQTTSYGYDFRERLQSIQTGTAQDLVLTYDNASNVKSVADGVAGETVTYGYDDLNRLTSASGFGGGLTASYDYNPIGNMTAKVEGGSALTLCYPAAGTPRPHAVTSAYQSVSATCGTGTPWVTLKHDADGNQISGGNHAYEFDEENRLSRIVESPLLAPPGSGFDCIDQDGNGQINFNDALIVNSHFGTGPGWPGFARWDVTLDRQVTFNDVNELLNSFGMPCAGVEYRYVYDGNGTLIKREKYAAPGAAAPQSWTVYIGGMYEKNSDGSVVKYYSALGKTIAIRQVPSGGGAGTLLYPLTDHLGSTVGLLGTSGNLVPNSKTAYWPYGAVRSGGPITQTDKLYTGQQIEPGDSALGLYNYKARFYSTVLGRFVSADSSTKDGPNRYAYVRDNPARYNDPSGKKTAQEKDAEDDAANLRRLAAWGLDTPEKVRLALLAADGYNAKWAGAGLIFAGALSNGQPIRLHSRETILEDNQSGYDFWSTKSTDEIIASLKPGNAEGYPPLTLNENGVVMDGNTRLQVLVDRGYNLTELPVEPLIHTRVTFEEPAEPVDPNPGDFEGAPLSELPGVTEGDASDTEDCTVDPASCDY